MPSYRPQWLPTPEEIAAECARIRAEKGELAPAQRADLRSLFVLDDDASDDASDDDSDSD